jgi:hypothetical protein
VKATAAGVRTAVPKTSEKLLKVPKGIRSQCVDGWEIDRVSTRAALNAPLTSRASSGRDFRSGSIATYLCAEDCLSQPKCSASGSQGGVMLAADNRELSRLSDSCRTNGRPVETIRAALPRDNRGGQPVRSGRANELIDAEPAPMMAVVR